VSSSPDQRRVCDLSTLELLEAAVAACADLGWMSGRWAIEVHVEDGQIRRALPRLLDAAPARAAVGRRTLKRRNGELGNAA